MLGLSYKVVYKMGVDNRVADALSRHIHSDTEELLMVSQCKPVWLEEVQQGYEWDPIATAKLAQLAIHNPQGHYSLQQGIIRHKNRLWIGSNSTMQQKIMQALHSGAIEGHSGFHATYHRVKHTFS
jgi:hypothetical protein